MNNTVVATVVVVGGTTALRVAYDPAIPNKPAAFTRVALGAFVAGALFTLLSNFSPPLASALAWLLIAATLLINGQVILKASSSFFR